MAGTLDAERGKKIWTAEQYAEALGHEAGNRTVGRVQTSPAAVTRSGGERRACDDDGAVRQKLVNPAAKRSVC